MVSKFLRGWLACVLLICLATNMILADDRVLTPAELVTQPITTTTIGRPLTVPAATAIPIPLLTAPNGLSQRPSPMDAFGLPATNTAISTWRTPRLIGMLSGLWLLAVVIFLVFSAPQPRRWDLGFPHLFIPALVYLLGITTVALFTYLLLPILASSMPAKLSAWVSAVGTLLLILLLAVKELVPTTGNKGNAWLRSLNIVLLPLWILFLITVVSRLLALVQF